MGNMRLSLVTCVGLLAGVQSLTAQEVPPPDAARASLEHAVRYFRDRLGVEGTYVWRYSADGQIRRGEGAAPPSVGWVQPPGTPAVGAAFLRTYEVTGDMQWLKAAHDVARALVKTQLLSGGWYYFVETDPELATAWCYRASGLKKKDCKKIRENPDRDRTVLDDNTTQSALNFLMWFDQASEGEDSKVRDSIDFGLQQLMEVQYRNGAFPTAFSSDKVLGADEKTASKASLPATWSREWQKPEASPYFIVNDNLPRDVGRMFLNAYRAYGEPEHLRTAMQIGDFLVATQLPEPQQGWAQAYDRSLQPVWGRKFEPPAVASLETAGSIDYLVEIHEQTSKARYLEAAAAAAEWLSTIRLPDGAWARFYELNTNRPLYVDADQKVTFDDQNLLSHYTMKVDAGIGPVLDRFRRASREGHVSRSGFWIDPAEELSAEQLDEEVRRLIETQDGEGRWVDDGWVDGAAFVQGVFILARYVELASEGAEE